MLAYDPVDWSEGVIDAGSFADFRSLSRANRIFIRREGGSVIAPGKITGCHLSTCPEELESPTIRIEAGGLDSSGYGADAMRDAAGARTALEDPVTQEGCGGCGRTRSLRPRHACSGPPRAWTVGRTASMAGLERRSTAPRPSVARCLISGNMPDSHPEGLQQESP